MQRIFLLASFRFVALIQIALAAALPIVAPAVWRLDRWPSIANAVEHTRADVLETRKHKKTRVHSKQPGRLLVFDESTVASARESINNRRVNPTASEKQRTDEEDKF